jgi:hypothetical protein
MARLTRLPASLFEDAAHAPLLALLAALLPRGGDGLAVLMAPPRGGSLARFVAAARAAGWHVHVTEGAPPRDAPAADPDTHTLWRVELRPLPLP